MSIQSTTGTPLPLIIDPATGLPATGDANAGSNGVDVVGTDTSTSNAGQSAAIGALASKLSAQLDDVTTKLTETERILATQVANGAVDIPPPAAAGSAAPPADLGDKLNDSSKHVAVDMFEIMSLMLQLQANDRKIASSMALEGGKAAFNAKVAAADKSQQAGWTAAWGEIASGATQVASGGLQVAGGAYGLSKVSAANAAAESVQMPASLVDDEAVPTAPPTAPTATAASGSVDDDIDTGTQADDEADFEAPFREGEFGDVEMDDLSAPKPGTANALEAAPKPQSGNPTSTEQSDEQVDADSKASAKAQADDMTEEELAASQDETPSEVAADPQAQPQPANGGKTAQETKAAALKKEQDYTDYMKLRHEKFDEVYKKADAILQFLPGLGSAIEGVGKVADGVTKGVSANQDADSKRDEAAAEVIMSHVETTKNMLDQIRDTIRTMQSAFDSDIQSTDQSNRRAVA